MIWLFLWWFVGFSSFAGFVMLMEEKLTLGTLLMAIVMGSFGLLIPGFLILWLLISVIIEYSDIEIWRKK